MFAAAAVPRCLAEVKAPCVAGPGCNCDSIVAKAVSWNAYADTNSTQTPVLPPPLSVLRYNSIHQLLLAGLTCAVPYFRLRFEVLLLGLLGFVYVP